MCAFHFTTLSCQAHWYFPEEERDFLLVQEVIRVARSLRAQCGMTKEKPASKSLLSYNLQAVFQTETNSFI